MGWLARLCLVVALSAGSALGGDRARLASWCDVGEVVSDVERENLFSQLRISIAGRAILSAFVRQYGSLENLVIQWDSVSYSQVASSGNTERAPAALGQLGEGICVHLAKKLPELEHVADLAHELTHATRLEMKVLRGDVQSESEFVRARLGGPGGEADAFAAECRVKKELLGSWDGLCAPYASIKGNGAFDVKRVVRDLYEGVLSASLTGETYPVLLSRQFRAMRDRASRRLAENSQERRVKPVKYSGLENKRGIQ